MSADRTLPEWAEHDPRCQTLVQRSPVGIYLTDAVGACTYVNPSWCRMAGMDAAQALGNGWIHAIHPDDRRQITSRWRQLMRGQADWNIEYRMQTRNGKITWVFGQAVELSDPEEGRTGFLGINIDITRRKRAEDALRASEHRFAQLLSAVTSYRYEVQLRDGRACIHTAQHWLPRHDRIHAGGIPG